MISLEGKPYCNHEFDKIKAWPKDVYEIMQFTGSLDHNDKEIYEGDIIEYYDGILYVQYCEEYAKFGGLIIKQNGEDVENDSFVWFDEPINYRGKVIGNCFENPELIK